MKHHSWKDVNEIQKIPLDRYVILYYNMNMKKKMPRIPDQRGGAMPRKRRAKAPPQITLGGDIGVKAWKRYVLPMIKDAKRSTREIGKALGVSHNTIALWRRAYL